MPGRNKSDAIDSFCHFFKESLSCLTDAYLHPIQKSANRFLLTYEPPAALLCDHPRTVSIAQEFSVRSDREGGRYKVKTHQYSYSLNGQEDGEWKEIVSYHWHPEGTAVSFPHAHIGCVPRVHFPTARVSVEKFIRMLIDYYDMAPIIAESRWKPILKRNDQAFDAMATWK
ncbi:MAG TPA: hypothetical protein VGU63_16170 [Candidatus Acidoferrales bacterium]|nr:hypothetical protein [Candidatus Acidoferrales bacterium]